MAYPIQGGSIAEVTLEYHVNDQLCMNVLHYWLDDTVDLTDGRAALLDLLDALNDVGQLIPRYQDCISDLVTDINAYAQWITPDRYRYVVDPGGPYNGTVADLLQPQNVAIALTKQAEVADRHGQGTVHLGGIPQTWITNGVVNQVAAGAALDDLSTAILTVQILPGGEEMSPVIFNRAAPDESPFVATCEFELTSRVMRRRTKGVGK